MNRLTGFNKRTGQAYIEGYAEYLPAEIKMALVQVVVKKCWDYENTGLEPEEINELLHDSTGPLHKKLGEWIKAETEGRLVVLPCKVGDTVYCIRKSPFAKGGRYVKENIAESITVYRDHSISIFSTLDDVLGKTVFLTREGAEAALRRGADR